MEDMVSSPWRGRRVLLTGDTGFKGSWMALWLSHLGANVHGYSLDPPGTPNLFTEARVHERICHTRADMLDLEQLCRVTAAFEPEIIFHLAAQSLVRRSYMSPVETYSTNVMGTVHALEAARRTPSVRAVLCITTDKCYENHEWHWGYREDDRLGGHDPYSSSKACAELVAAAYRDSFFAGASAPMAAVALATARAGNVIGGGDWAEDRLIPDLVRAFGAGVPAVIRNPESIRPWQHVLEPLRGYLMLGERLLAGDGACASAWNFGPSDEDARPVEWVVRHMAGRWAAGAEEAPPWRIDDGGHPHEASYLKLDCSRARALLGWQPLLRLPDALARTVEWFQQWRAGADMQRYTLQEIMAYEQLAAAEGLSLD